MEITINLTHFLIAAAGLILLSFLIYIIFCKYFIRNKNSIIKKNIHLNSIHFLLKHMLTSLKLEDILYSSIKTAADLVGANAGSIGLYDSENNIMTYPINYNLPDEVIKNLEVDPSKGVAAYTIQQRKTLIINNYPEHPRALKEFTDAGTQAIIAFPMFVENEPIGTLGVFSKSNRRFTQKDVDVLQPYIDAISVAIRLGTVIRKYEKIIQNYDNILSAFPGYVFKYSLKNDEIISFHGKIDKLFNNNVPKNLQQLKDLIPKDKISVLSDYIKTIINTNKPVNFRIDLKLDCFETEYSLLISLEPIINEKNILEEIEIFALDETYIQKLKEQLKISQEIALIGKFSSSIAHEFNNLILLISSNLERIMLKNSQGLDISLPVSRLFTAIERSKVLIHNVYSLSSFQTNYRKPEYLEKIIDHCIDLSKTIFINNKIEVNKTFNNKFPILIDASQCQHLIFNLISNSRKAVEKKGYGTITIKTESTDKSVIFTFSDNGIGMTAEQLDSLFNPMVSSSKIKSEHDFDTGLGLGLFIIKSIIESNGGTLQIKSIPEKGTSFIIEFPLCQFDVTDDSTVPIDKSNSESHKKYTVLIVDDEEDITESLSDLLNGYSHSTYILNDPKNIINFLDKKNVDIIIMDFIIPEGNAGKYFFYLKEKYPKIPVIFITGQQRHEIDKVLGNKYSYDYLQKPFSTDDLLKSINMAYEKN